MATTDPAPSVLQAFALAFRAQRALADGAIAQLSGEQIRASLDPQTNSVGVIMRHLAGNLRSRFTDFLTSDGEKAWRDRDAEFAPELPPRLGVIEHWEQGWAVLFSALESLAPADLSRTVAIRGQPHTVPQALARALAHCGYHAGQIVLISRVLVSRAGGPWNTLTIPRGGTGDFNRALGYEPFGP